MTQGARTRIVHGAVMQNRSMSSEQVTRFIAFGHLGDEDSPGPPTTSEIALLNRTYRKEEHGSP